MVLIGKQFVGFWDNIPENVIRDMEGNSQFGNDMREYEKKLEENDKADLEYKNYMLCIGAGAEGFEPHKKRKHIYDDIINNSDSETDGDPRYELFLKNLNEHGNCYAVKDEKDDLLVYEGDTDSDEEYDQEPVRKLRSGKVNQEHVLPETSRGKSRNRDKSEEIKNNVKRPINKIVLDPDYDKFLRNLEIVDDHIVARYGDNRIIYQKKDGGDHKEKEEYDYEDSSDVEIIDSASFYKEEMSSPVLESMNKDRFHSPGSQSEFKQKVIRILRKPYDKKEFDKLWKEITFCRAEGKYKDLRGGREYVSKMNFGKSYLDYYPDLRKQLLRFEKDKSKCLNLIRGFFFWLQNLEHKGSFRPWQDPECQSTSPESMEIMN